MKQVFTRAFWQKMDDVQRILMSATMALLAIFPVLLAPKLWNALLALNLPDLVRLREWTLGALYHAFETPAAIVEALAMYTLMTMMFGQVLQGLLRAAIRGRSRAGKDTSSLAKRETPLAWAAGVLLAVPSLVFSVIFMLPVAGDVVELNNAAVTNGAILITALLTLLAMFMSVAVVAATVRGSEPEGPIKIFACMKAPWAFLCLLFSGFGVNVVAVAVSMVVLDVLLAPLDKPADQAADASKPTLTKG
jgi:hypothetical protein